MSNDWQFFFSFPSYFCAEKALKRECPIFPWKSDPCAFRTNSHSSRQMIVSFCLFFLECHQPNESVDNFLFVRLFRFFCAVCSGVGSFLAEIRDIEAVSMCLLSVQCRKLIESGWNGNERINGQGDLTAAKKKTIRTEQKRTKSKIEIYL